jgi:hypothetical protein
MRTHLTALLTLLFVGWSLARGQAVAEQAAGQPAAPEIPPPSQNAQVLETSADALGAETWTEPYQAPQRFWARAEYLLWGIKDSSFPPLISTGPASDPRPGSLDSASTHVLFGGPNVSNRDRNGGRFFGGWWFAEQNEFGVQAGYFFLGGRSVGTFQSSPGNPVLARPFFNANAGIQDASLIAFPGIASGNVKVDVPSFLQGAEANLTGAFWQASSFRLEGLAGFRYLNLEEGLHIAENVQVGATSPVFAGNQILITDVFDTHNNFYGGQLGARAEYRRKRWFVNVLTKVALGDANQVVAIRGLTTVNTQPLTSANAGLLAVASNSGRFTRDNFAVVPEVNANVGFQITQRLRGFIGYSFLYLSRAARPGDQVDTAVNVNQVPTSATYGVVGGQARPQFVFRSSDFWAQGVNFGLEFRF